MNNQAPEKRATGDGVTLAVNSVFYTLQGEGPHAGRPAVFIRLAGCNLQCPLCDTQYTARAGYDVSELVELALSYSWHMRGRRDAPLVVITGGEPFRQPIGHLVTSLISEGLLAQIETNGTMWQEGPWDDPRVMVVCSPKVGHVHTKLLPHVAAWKYVARADDLAYDGLPRRALDHPTARGLYRPPADHLAPIYLQPADQQDADTNAVNARAVAESCMQHGYRLCLQMHKIVNVP